MTTCPVALDQRVTTKGKYVLLFDGYSYRLNQDSEKRKYWWCEDHTCSVFVHTDGYSCYQEYTGSHDGPLLSTSPLKSSQLRLFPLSIRVSCSSVVLTKYCVDEANVNHILLTNDFNNIDFKRLKNDENKAKTNRPIKWKSDDQWKFTKGKSLDEFGIQMKHISGQIIPNLFCRLNDEHSNTEYMIFQNAINTPEYCRKLWFCIGIHVKNESWIRGLPEE